VLSTNSRLEAQEQQVDKDYVIQPATLKAHMKGWYISLETNFYGILSRIDGKALQPVGKANFAGTMYHVLYGGKYYTIAYYNGKSDGGRAIEISCHQLIGYSSVDILKL
jgi:hypothetical protein